MHWILILAALAVSLPAFAQQVPQQAQPLDTAITDGITFLTKLRARINEDANEISALKTQLQESERRAADLQKKIDDPAHTPASQPAR